MGDAAKDEWAALVNDPPAQKFNMQLITKKEAVRRLKAIGLSGATSEYAVKRMLVYRDGSRDKVSADAVTKTIDEIKDIYRRGHEKTSIKPLAKRTKARLQLLAN